MNADQERYVAYYLGIYLIKTILYTAALKETHKEMEIY